MASFGKKLAIGAGVVVAIGALAFAATALAEEEDEKRPDEDEEEEERPSVDPGFASACREEGGTVVWDADAGDWTCKFPDGTVVTQTEALGPKPPPIDVGEGVVVKPGEDVTLDATVDRERVWMQLPYEAVDLTVEEDANAEVVEQVPVGDPGDTPTLASPYLGTLFVRWRMTDAGTARLVATNLNTQERYVVDVTVPVETATFEAQP